MGVAVVAVAGRARGCVATSSTVVVLLVVVVVVVIVTSLCSNYNAEAHWN